MKQKKIYLNRIKELNNRTRGYKIFLNGQYYEDILNNEDKIILIDSESTELFLKIDWCKSKKIKIKFQDNETEKKYIISSSISNNTWHIIVGGIVLSLGLFFSLKINLFGILAIIFVLIPVYKITFGKNKYLILRKIED